MSQFYEKGLKFECQGSGKCCVTREGYGYVYVTLQDRRRFAKHLGITTARFTQDYCRKTNGFFHLIDGADGNCKFLKDKRCSAYEARPTQCRTWPFWPENMNAKAWKKEIASFCPGVGKGRTWSKEEIETQVNEQARADIRT